MGRDYKRDPAKVLAEDIAPFPAFGWQDDFEYNVGWKKKSVTVTAPGGASADGPLPRRPGLHHSPARRQDPLQARQGPPPAARRREPGLAHRRQRRHRPPSPRSIKLPSPPRSTARCRWEEQNTRSLVVVYKGKIIGERYAPGFTKDTPQIGWSQGKSITAALIAVLMQQGELKLDDPAPIKEWQQPDDPRRKIRIKDLLRMSSGLDFDNWGLGEPRSYTKANEHFRIYFRLTQRLRPRHSAARRSSSQHQVRLSQHRPAHP